MRKLPWIEKQIQKELGENMVKYFVWGFIFNLFLISSRKQFQSDGIIQASLEEGLEGQLGGADFLTALPEDGWGREKVVEEVANINQAPKPTWLSSSKAGTLPGQLLSKVLSNMCIMSPTNSRYEACWASVTSKHCLACATGEYKTDQHFTGQNCRLNIGWVDNSTTIIWKNIETAMVSTLQF